MVEVQDQVAEDQTEIDVEEEEGKQGVCSNGICTW
tara:strand:+ start:6639 stop:6743 length:105 start_codon:yes stop_codon:yes gene_type:complete